MTGEVGSIDGSARSAEVLDQLCVEIAALFGDEFGSDEIRTEVDVFAGDKELVEGFAFDSLDLVRVIALVEDLFDVALGNAFGDDESVTLAAVAHHVVKARGGDRA